MEEAGQDHPLATRAGEEGEFGLQQGRRAFKRGQMRFPQMGQNSRIRVDAGGQPLHLPGGADARFHERGDVARRQGPQGRGDAQLAVVGTGAGMEGLAVAEEGGEPFFDNGFSVAPGDADDGGATGLAPRADEGLKSDEGIGEAQDVGVGEDAAARIGCHHEVPNAFLPGFAQVGVAISPGAAEGQESGGREAG